ncbi:methylated-DNA--[protein]-cysteine S-methyltransferase [Parasporobacterium paucivorans]|uniref:Methylated-DNA--protein-cysteine methyltransferase n=1 Tax=Parasporobacterium paucivorans DSM 15970 TaxID=1122934 RepID=A0A1M6A4F3_9FIRM|nr:methylated-DNA--[protein]-cysteine S-methyltransferase [Parasporobacterium paucivorans]SHI31358.1 methylated-DNA-[protein]-cysteine S-methyltransferase [Parasporobacterium paucivorans DSM 15970]
MGKAYYCYSTMIGEVTIASSEDVITNIYFGNVHLPFPEKETEILRRTALELKEYLNGDRKNFDVPIELKGTEFEVSVWNELQNIPYGETACYSQIAERIGNPKACRAVGGANGRNPIPIIIPCHRVISKDKTLGGFSGGLDIKEKLLAVEKNNLPRT